LADFYSTRTIAFEGLNSYGHIPKKFRYFPDEPHIVEFIAAAG
jgi:hypothetical protein